MIRLIFLIIFFGVIFKVINSLITAATGKDEKRKHGRGRRHYRNTDWQRQGRWTRHEPSSSQTRADSGKYVVDSDTPSRNASASTARSVVSKYNYRVDPEVTRKTGVTSQMLNETLEKLDTKVDQMRGYKAQISKPEVQEKVEQICGVIGHIGEEFKKDPGDIKKARQFLNYYLDSTIKILRRYTELSRGGTSSSEIEESLHRVETLLNTIYEAFNKQLARLLENNVLDLNVEMEVLEKSLKMEGF